MSRLLILTLLILIAVLLLDYCLRRALRWMRERYGDSAGSTTAGGAGRRTGGRAPRLGGQLARCDACGVHAPESRMLSDGPRRFCSETCRQRLHRRAS